MMTTSAPNLLRTTAASLAIAGLALVGAPAVAGAQSYPSSTSATFSDATPVAGQTVAISGTATPGATVTVTLTADSGRNLAMGSGSGSTLGTTTADATGAFSLNVTIPSDLAAGNYVLAVMEGPTVLSSSAFAVAGATTQGGATPGQSGNGTTPAQTPAQTGDNASAPAGTLPVTGNNAGYLGWGGAAFIVGGGAALVISKRRTDPESI